jgi:hypothetical protein
VQAQLQPAAQLLATAALPSKKICRAKSTSCAATTEVMTLEDFVRESFAGFEYVKAEEA